MASTARGEDMATRRSVAIVSSMTGGTGNAVTAARYASLLEDGGVRVVGVFHASDASPAALAAAAPDAVLALHVTRSGARVLGCGRPLVVVLAGARAAAGTCATAALLAG